MFEEFTTAVKAQLYERVSSPLLSSFVVSWCCWNYKLILILVSSMSALEKIVYIDLNLFPDAASVVWRGVALPLITSLFLIFVYPYPAEFTYKHAKKNQRRLKEIQQLIDDESPLSKAQARKIRRESLESQLRFESEMDQKANENERLKELVASLQREWAETNISEAEVKSTSEGNDRTGSKGLMDMFVVETLNEYMVSAFGSRGSYLVEADGGRVVVYLLGEDGGKYSYITGEYSRATVMDTIKSIEQALADDSSFKGVNRKD